MALKNLFHNCIVHPFCGVLWFMNVEILSNLADYLHNYPIPKGKDYDQRS